MLKPMEESLATPLGDVLQTLQDRMLGPAATDFGTFDIQFANNAVLGRQDEGIGAGGQ